MKGKPVPLAVESLVHGIDENGLAGIALQKIKNNSVNDNRIESALHQTAIHWHSIILARQPHLIQLAQHCNEQKIPILFMKGCCMSYNVYDSPGLRPSNDVDLIIKKDNLSSLWEILATLGYELPQDKQIKTLTYQFSGRKPLHGNHYLELDIHHRLSNTEDFAKLFEFDELQGRSSPLLTLHTDCRGLGKLDSILLACIHRQNHLIQNEPERLAWLYDIHLLVQQLTPQDEAALIDLMKAKGLVNICKSAIQTTQLCFDTPVPEQLNKFLITGNHPSELDKFLGSGPAKTIWFQFQAQPGWNQKLTLLKELFLPSKQKILEKYPNSKLPLSFLYIRRAVSGTLDRILK